MLERGFSLPEIIPGAESRCPAISFHFIDYVVHGWDVARALGVLSRSTPTGRAALPVAERFRGAALRRPSPTGPLGRPG